MRSLLAICVASIALFVAACSSPENVPYAAPDAQFPKAVKIEVTPGYLQVKSGSTVSVTVKENHYRGKFTSVSGRKPCDGIATWNPHRGHGPKLVVKVAGVGEGSCAIGFSNAMGSGIGWIHVTVPAKPPPTPSPLPTLKVTYFSFPVSSSGGHNAEGLTAGPDGNVWFTVDPFAVGRMTTAGVATLFQKGIPISSSIGNIAAGADNNLWFTEYRGAVGRITTTGSVTFFTPSPPPHPGFAPAGIAAGPGNDLYFIAEPSLYSITTAGTIDGVPLGASCPYATGSDSLGGVAKGPNNSVWVTTTSGCVIERPDLRVPLLRSAITFGAASFSKGPMATCGLRRRETRSSAK